MLDPTSPYKPPQANPPYEKSGARLRYIAWFACLCSWPAFAVGGWFLGDKQQLIYLKSMWDGPFPITSSPAFLLISLTLVPFALGLLVVLGRRKSKIGYLTAIGSSIIAGLLAYWFAFALNAI